MTFKKPYCIFVAGHRSTRDGGNPVERSFTDDLAKAYCDVFRAAGYKADWWQRDLDKDNLPDMTEGGLDTVAKGVGAAIGKADADLVLMYDLHFDGGTSVVHSIVPDVTGLRSAYAGGAPAVDTASNNTLDCSLAAEISAELSRTLFNGDNLYPARRLGIKGVMSERDTNVGSQGYRLAMMGGTAPYRMKAARLVIEHAGYDQTTKIADWANKSAKAALRATERVLDARGGPVDGGGQPDPVPDPGDFAPVLPTPALQPYVSAGTLVKTPPAVVVGAEGEYVYVGHRVKAIRATPRRQKSTADSEKVGVDVAEGTSFIVLFAHRNEDGAWWYITGWWSHFPVGDTEIISEVAE